jgi:F-type H+-transporting ATPase subunit b
MPQLDFSTYPAQLFWLVLSFTALYFVLAVFVLPRLTKVQSLRAESTSGKRKNAEEATALAEEALAEYETQINASRTKAQKEAQVLRAATDKVLVENRESIETRLESEIDSSEKEIKDFLSNNQEEMLQAAALTTQALVQKTTNTSITESESLAEVQRGKAQ